MERLLVTGESFLFLKKRVLTNTFFLYRISCSRTSTSGVVETYGSVQRKRKLRCHMAENRPDVTLETGIELPGMRWMKGMVASFERPDGQPVRWEGISGGEGVLVLPITTTGKVVLVHQYRFLIEKFSFELPGGTPNDGEEALETGMRELLEETGYKAGRVYQLGQVALWNGKSNAYATLLVAERCYKVREPNLDPVEQVARLTVKELTMDEILTRIIGQDDEFNDATVGHSILAFLHLY